MANSLLSTGAVGLEVVSSGTSGAGSVGGAVETVGWALRALSIIEAVAIVTSGTDVKGGTSGTVG
jgi:hypothetical protein